MKAFFDYMEIERLSQIPIRNISDYAVLNMNNLGQMTICLDPIKGCGYRVKKDDLRRVVETSVSTFPISFILVYRNKKDMRKYKTVDAAFTYINYLLTQA